MYTERGVADEGVWWTCTQRGVWQMKGCGGHVHREGCGRWRGTYLYQCRMLSKQSIIMLNQQFCGSAFLWEFFDGHDAIGSNVRTSHQGWSEHHSQVLTVHPVLVLQQLYPVRGGGEEGRRGGGEMGRRGGGEMGRRGDGEDGRGGEMGRRGDGEDGRGGEMGRRGDGEDGRGGIGLEWNT